MWVGTGVWWGRVRGGMGVGWQVRLDGGIELGGFGSGEGGFVLAQGGVASFGMAYPCTLFVPRQFF